MARRMVRRGSQRMARLPRTQACQGPIHTLQYRAVRRELPRQFMELRLKTRSLARDHQFWAQLQSVVRAIRWQATDDKAMLVFSLFLFRGAVSHT